MMLKAAIGLEHMHKAGYCHSDVKPSNMLIMQDNCVKIADLGLAHRLHPHSKVVVDPCNAHGTPGYMAPEVQLRPELVSVKRLTV
jgi:serine/threonine protein kinase